MQAAAAGFHIPGNTALAVMLQPRVPVQRRQRVASGDGKDEGRAVKKRWRNPSPAAQPVDVRSIASSLEGVHQQDQWGLVLASDYKIRRVAQEILRINGGV